MTAHAIAIGVLLGSAAVITAVAFVGLVVAWLQ